MLGGHLRLTDAGVRSVAACLRHKGCLDEFGYCSPDHHEEPWYPHSWLKPFPTAEPWHSIFADSALANPISRQNIKALAQRIEPGVPFATLVSGVFTWGAGKRAWIWPSRLRRLSEDADNLERLRQLCIAAKTLSPLESYSLLRSSDWSTRVKGLGPSYGTKFLYFSGFDSRSDGDAPLILDKRVAASIRVFASGVGEEFAPALDFNWSPLAYAEYVDLAREATPRVVQELGANEVSTDSIEFALFWLNGDASWRPDTESGTD